MKGPYICLDCKLRMSNNDLGNVNDSFNSKAAFDLGGSDDEYRPDLQEFPWNTDLREAPLFTRYY